MTGGAEESLPRPTLTPEQERLVRRALGLDRARISERNRLVAGPEDPAFKPMRDLVRAGLAETRGPNRAFEGRSVFRVTHACALLALQLGEELHPDDFPEPRRRPSPALIPQEQIA